MKHKLLSILNSWVICSHVLNFPFSLIKSLTNIFLSQKLTMSNNSILSIFMKLLSHRYWEINFYQKVYILQRNYFPLMKIFSVFFFLSAFWLTAFGLNFSFNVRVNRCLMRLDPNPTWSISRVWTCNCPSFKLSY